MQPNMSIHCFAAGTRILTEAGQVAVEDLHVGEYVLTMRDGTPVSRKILWTGKRSLDASRHPAPGEIRPIRIYAGALAPGLPERDLRLSPRHALLIDGVLVEARALVNDATVVQEHGTDRVSYHHIELATHDVVLAEGVPAETFLDTGGRDSFADGTVTTLHPDFKVLDHGGFCAPLIGEGKVLAGIRQRLLDRAEALGFTRVSDIDLRLRPINPAA
jgi:hypothetical protein